jgi:hypothetical protein
MRFPLFATDGTLKRYRATYTVTPFWNDHEKKDGADGPALAIVVNTVTALATC